MYPDVDGVVLLYLSKNIRVHFKVQRIMIIYLCIRSLSVTHLSFRRRNLREVCKS
ncbi:unnamed protein product [Hymenolepis diminuta]|uniref:Uncharacterized protein n=1 Tax=Hymenolepis diminuta TaxID=6216 RepID=A0A564Z207_HYMDI|nr:unnamed protein product [Hymenolepis diminuta]